jgi:hypothetical protein
MNRKISLIVLFVLTSILGMAQARKYSNEFLAIGVSARALGMSNSVIATVNDVTAGYWNPAGLNSIENSFEVSLMHSEYFAGIAKFDYGAVAIPTKDKSRTMGFSMIRFGIDDIPYTLFLREPDGSINYDNISSFSQADYAFIFSYAQPIKWKNLKVGGNVKIIHRSAGSFAKAWGFGIDLGAQLDLDNWRFGLMARDITTTFNAWSFDFTDEEQAIFAQTNNVIPENSYEITLPKFLLGAAYQFTFSEKFGLLAELDLDITTDGKRNVLISGNPISIDPHLGLEVDYSRFIFFRAGVGNIQKATSDVSNKKVYTFQPNIGVGLRISNVYIDYAFTDIGNQSQALYSHVFSLKFAFNKRAKKTG